MEDEQARARLGETVDRYVLEEVLGVGGFGAVYRARHVHMGRPVALKVLHPQPPPTPEMQERFLREARAASAIAEPGIVQVFDCGITPQGEAFLAMELLDGEDLADHLDRVGTLPTGRAVELTRAILRPLGAAHRAGVVHRDLKPANVFLAGDAVKILDFGISKLEGDGVAPLTRTGVVMGTPHYMAPETFRGAASVDARADLYAVGAMLFEMLTGRPPHDAETHERLVVKVATEPVMPFRSVVPGASDALAAVIDRALELDPGRRFPSAEAMAAALAPLAAEAAEMGTAATAAGPSPMRAGTPATRANPDAEPWGSPAATPQPVSSGGWGAPASGGNISGPMGGPETGPMIPPTGPMGARAPSSASPASSPGAAPAGASVAAPTRSPLWLWGALLGIGLLVAVATPIALDSLTRDEVAVAPAPPVAPPGGPAPPVAPLAELVPKPPVTVPPPPTSPPVAPTPPTSSPRSTRDPQSATEAPEAPEAPQARETTAAPPSSGVLVGYPRAIGSLSADAVAAAVASRESALRRCGEGAPVQVRVQLLVSPGGRIAIAQPDPTEDHGPEAQARCAASVLRGLRTIPGGDNGIGFVTLRL